MAGENKLMDIWIKPSFVSGEELAKRAESKRIAAEYAKLRKEELNAAAQAQERDMAEYIQRKNAERQARAPAFRQNVKAGDRMRLASGGSDSTGLVVEVKRPLVLVQFDRMTVNNESKRWIKIEDIEPGQ
jgi:sRNA-binding protein